MSIGTLQTDRARFDVDGFGVEARQDGFYRVRLFLGSGLMIHHLTLDSTDVGKWYLVLADCAAAEVEPELEDPDTRFDCALDVTLPSVALTLDGPRRVRRFELVATRAPWAVQLRLGLDGGSLAFEGGRWVQRDAAGRTVAADVRFEAALQFPWAP
jgi:hypothetical protein